MSTDREPRLLSRRTFSRAVGLDTGAVAASLAGTPAAASAVAAT
ncbi:hypothetical protein [Streptomyces sp. NPDC057702]